MKRVMAVIAAAALTGCGPSLDEVRVREPAARVVVQTKSDRLADCLEDYWLHAVDVRRRVRENAIELVGISTLGGVGRVPAFIVLLSPEDDVTTRIELRQPPSIWGPGPTGWFTDAVRHCLSGGYG